MVFEKCFENEFKLLHVSLSVSATFICSLIASKASTSCGLVVAYFDMDNVSTVVATSLPLGLLVVETQQTQALFLITSNLSHPTSLEFPKKITSMYDSRLVVD